MKLDSSLAMILPQKFCGLIPLFIGVEIVLVISILNKAGGAFGIVSLLTGHPINFFQWLYNMSCLVILPFYIMALGNITTRLKNVRKMSLVCLIYTFDTVFGILYTFYFTYFWFSREDSNPTTAGGNKRDAYTDGSQSASPARELFLMVSSTLISTVVRLYFNLIIVSFTRSLIKQNAGDSGHDLIAEDEHDIFQSKTLIHKLRKAIFELEIRSKEILVDFFT